jgi:hypothetical protein
MSSFRPKICTCAEAESRKSKSAIAAIDPRFGESADAAADYPVNCPIEAEKDVVRHPGQGVT